MKILFEINYLTQTVGLKRRLHKLEHTHYLSMSYKLLRLAVDNIHKVAVKIVNVAFHLGKGKLLWSPRFWEPLSL